MIELRVFISHRADEDGAIALVVKDALESLSSNAIAAFVCQETPGSADWRDWIEKEVAGSDVMVFLFTDERADWRWCTYELGLFRGKSSASTQDDSSEADRSQSTTGIVCLRNESIKAPPAPIENVQSYSANLRGIEDFLSDFLLKGLFTNAKALNQDLGSADGRRDFDRHVKAILARFRPAVQTTYYAIRMSLGLSRVESGRIIEIPLEQALITGGDQTMRLLGLPDDGGTWKRVYDRFKRRGQHKWLDELRESVVAIRNGERLEGVLTPFRSNDMLYKPVLSRTDLSRPSSPEADEDVEVDNGHMIANRLFVIFVPMPELSTTSDIDTFDLENIRLPSSIVRQSWHRRSYDVEYDPKNDPDGAPVIYRANREFGMLYNLNVHVLPDPNGPHPLNVVRLLGRVEDCVEPTHLQALVADQNRVATEIIFRNNPNFVAQVPLQFNRKHPHGNYANAAFLPRLIWSRTDGNVNEHHESFYLISYVRHFDLLE